jgi:hypothetical protein
MKREVVGWLVAAQDTSLRRACRVVGLSTATWRYQHDLRVEGRFRVTDQGAIRRTELLLRDRESLGSATVGFRDDAVVGLRVPITMTETYARQEELIEGSAEYSNFRRFSAKTFEKLAKPPGN